MRGKGSFFGEQLRLITIRNRTLIVIEVVGDLSLPRGHSVKLLPNIIVGHVIKLPKRSAISAGGVLLACEVAKVDLLLVDPDLGPPFASLFIPVDAREARPPAHSLAPVVGGVVHDAEVGNAVVERISVNMVDAGPLDAGLLQRVQHQQAVYFDHSMIGMMALDMVAPAQTPAPHLPHHSLLIAVDDEDLVAVRESHLRDGSFRGVDAHGSSCHTNIAIAIRPSLPSQQQELTPQIDTPVQHTHRMF